MADWKKLAKELILADGYIERKETEIVKKSLLADGVISKSEAEFLVEGVDEGVALFEMAGEGVEIAIVALGGAEGDVEVEGIDGVGGVAELGRRGGEAGARACEDREAGM